ncbi:MAG: metallophosphoesterase [Clostridia bacterium]|nr:metallophosphoesterase [Clostridia bacterium]
MSYTTYHLDNNQRRLLIVTDIHHCHPVWHDTKSEDRMELLCKTLGDAYEKSPYDAILALGDYSLDHWAWNEGGSFLWEPPVSNTGNFVRDYIPKTPAQWFMIPGNHEQYGPKDWETITGRPREYLVTYGDYLFLMLDTFGGELDPDYNHDGCYTGVNADLLAKALEAYPEKNIILCAHDLMPEREGEEVRRLIYENPRILCAFTGHTHRDNTRILSSTWRNLPVFYSGDFSYNGGRDKEKNWGYRILDLNGGFSTEYIRI